MSTEHGPQSLWVRTPTGASHFEGDQVEIGGDAQFAVVVRDPASTGHAMLARREAGAWRLLPMGSSTMWTGDSG